MGPNILISQNLESEKEVSNREVEAKSDNAGNTPNSIYTNQNLSTRTGANMALANVKRQGRNLHDKVVEVEQRTTHLKNMKKNGVGVNRIKQSLEGKTSRQHQVRDATEN